MRTALVLCVLLVLGACANPYNRFYHGMQDGRTVRGYDSADVSLNIYPTDDFMRDAFLLKQHGYMQIGMASFNAAANIPTNNMVRNQAEQIGAQVVLVSTKFSHMATGVFPLSIPKVSTTISTLSGTVSGPHGSLNVQGIGSGVTTSSDTVMVPFATQYNEFSALFFVKARPILGVLPRSLNNDERSRLQTNHGIVADIVVDGSPAFNADILPGDVLLEWNDNPIDDVKNYEDLLRQYRGQWVSLKIDRSGTKIGKKVLLAQIPDSGSVSKTVATNADVASWVERSNNSNRAGDWLEGVRTATVAIGMDSSNADAYLNRCWSYIGLNDIKDAKTDCERAHSLNPQDSGAVNNLGVIAEREGNAAAVLTNYSSACMMGFDLGCENFKRIKGYSPKDHASYEKLRMEAAISNFAAKDWDSVIAITSEVVELDSNHEGALVTRAGAYINKGQLDAAQRDIDRAIQLNPDDGQAYNNAGVIQAMRGDKVQARIQYQIACRHGSQLGCDNAK